MALVDTPNFRDMLPAFIATLYGPRGIYMFFEHLLAISIFRTSLAIIRVTSCLGLGPGFLVLDWRALSFGLSGKAFTRSARTSGTFLVSLQNPCRVIPDLLSASQS